MKKMQAAVASAAALTSAALVLPALAQSVNDTETDASVGTSAEIVDDAPTTDAGTGTSGAAMEEELDAAAEADVSADTAEDDGTDGSGAAGGTTGTGVTIPNELPDTGGGWGASLR